jgi:hypothetical protein
MIRHKELEKSDRVELTLFLGYLIMRFFEFLNGLNLYLKMPTAFLWDRYSTYLTSGIIIEDR